MTDPNAPFDNTQPPQSPTPAPAPGVIGADTAGMVSAESADAKTMGMLCHLLAIFTWWIAPLIIWLIKKDQSPFVNQQGKEALNWGLTITTAFVACMILMFIPFVNFLLCLLWPAVAVCNIVFGILSTIKVNSGLPYRYPVCIRYIS